ncbi:MAG: T9SS type A sorting domain-containing protein [Ignavibacterium sp.]|nr:T9SS type A sorting domain-containing protein [Ignavibacterium sp.]
MKTLTSLMVSLLLFFSSHLFAQDFGQLLFNTDYDYLYNNSPVRYIEMLDYNNDGNLDPVVFIRGKLYYRPDTTWLALEPFGQTTSSRGLQYCNGGPLDGKLLLLSSGGFSVVDPSTWQFNTFQPGTSNLQSFAYTSDGTIYAFGNDYNIFKSTDQGLTFDQHIRVGDGDPNINIGSVSGSAGLPIKISENGQYLSIVGGFAEASANGIDDIIYLYHSPDFGATWQGQILGIDGVYGQVSNRNYAPFFENFSQMSYEVDNDGKTHVVINGYGKGVLEGSTDTTDVFPVLYWNSNYDKWTAVTEPSNERPDDGHGNVVSLLRPGNGIGNAYPTISITPEGNGMMILWQSIEYTSGFGSPFNIYPGDNSGNSYPVYYTDINYVLGYDAGPNFGIEWLHGIWLYLPFDNSRTEQYPVLSPFFESTGVPFIYEGFYIYQYDAIPGVSLFNQNSPSVETAWYYNSFLYLGTSVDDDLISDLDFYLAQNYPNPFNPSTKIRWQSPVGSHQTIKVFDVLGREVATLVDEYRNAGSYEVEFDAAGLSSGIYFYTLKSGSFIKTLKMSVLK